MKKFVRAYIAGVIDGEGTITLTRMPKREFRYPCITVSSATLEILQFLQKHCGGSISTHKVYQSHHKQSWMWKIANRKAISLLLEIQPYLLDPEKLRRAMLITSEYIDLTPRNGRYTPAQHLKKKAFEQEFFHPSGTLA